MPVESVGRVMPPEPSWTDNRTEPAAVQAQPQQQPPQPSQERAPLPEASGWNVDLFA